MTSDDLPGFHDAFRSLQRVFPLRGSEADFDRMLADYFRMLRRYSLGQVKSAADHWLAHGTKFPKPSDWIGAVPAMTATDRRQMTQSEAQDYRRAELCAFEDQPCLCADCVRAGVDDKPLRFVPDLDGEDRDVKAFNPMTGRVVTTGQWAHGDALARWYDARATFFSDFLAWVGSPPTLREVGKERLRPAVQKAKRQERFREAVTTDTQS